MDLTPKPRLDVNYIFSGASVAECLRMFKNIETDDTYPWMTGERPKLVQRRLVTPIDQGTGLRNTLEKERFMKGNKGDKFLMFDSGGFQMLRNPRLKMETLIEENLKIVDEYDWADCYVLPDHPTPQHVSVEIMEPNLHESIEGGLRYFELAPDYVKDRAMPVFHVRKDEHIDLQLDAYKDILERSQKVCYAIAGTTKRMTPQHIRWMRRLKEAHPNIYFHLLGVGAQPAIYVMNKIGVNAFDVISPHWTGGNGRVADFKTVLDYSVHLPTSVSDEEIIAIRQKTGHRCPFCDDLKRLKSDDRFRRLHNLIVYEELNYFYAQISEEGYKHMVPKWYELMQEGFSDEPALPIEKKKPKKKKKEKQEDEIHQPSIFDLMGGI